MEGNSNNFRTVVNAAKRIVKTTLRIISKPFIIIAIIIVAILILIAAIKYFITLDDGTHKDNDWSNTPYATKQYMGSTSIGENGELETSMSAKELWDKMIENGSRVDEYLEGPEELVKLMKAEMVTQYPDTRANPDEEIDWDAILDPDSKDVQGIIKLKRADTSGNIKTMTYVDPETFQMYINTYNQTGSEADREIALSHFTLEKSYLSTNIMAGTIEAGTTIEIPKGLGSVHTYMGWQMITATTSTQYKLREQAGMNFDENGFGIINGRYVIACTTTFGQVGDYIDFYKEDGSVMPCIIGDIKNQNDDGCNQWGHTNGKCIVEFVVNKSTWYNGGVDNPNKVGDPTILYHTEWHGKNIVKAVNGGSYFTNPNFGKDSQIESNNDDDSENDNEDNSENEEANKDILKWPTDGTRITSYFGPRKQPTAGASTYHEAVDIGVPEGTNVYACQDGVVTTAGYSNSAGNMVVIDHGNGFVSKYFHNSKLKVSVGETVTKGQLIALSGNTGNSTGAHLHFGIYSNGTAVDPLGFKYDNNMGSGTGTLEGNAGTLSTSSTMYVKVATWTENTDRVVTNDPQVEAYDITTYNMTSTNVNYQSLVSKFTMPFDYLWAFLVTCNSKDFVMALADLVYESEMEITIYDNLTIDTNVEVTKREDVIEKSYYDDVTGEEVTYEVPVTYTTTHTTINKTNTINTVLTKANVWYVDYSQTYTYSSPTTSTSGTDENSHTTETQKYISSPANVREKTDLYPTNGEENFVTLIKSRKYFTAYNSILSAREWLFSILEKNDTTKDMVDLTKYLLYKATDDVSFGVTEFDFELFTMQDAISGGTFTGESITLGTYTFPHYLQKDYPGSYGTSTIPSSGCGPTSLAMILSGIKNDPSINPQTVVANIKEYWPSGSYYVAGVGSSHCIFYSDFLQKYYGVTSQMNISEATALDALEKGYPVIGGEDGHILAIVPVSEELKAQGYKFYILDSARGHDGPYKSVADANKVVKGSLGFIAIIIP